MLDLIRPPLSKTIFYLLSWSFGLTIYFSVKMFAKTLSVRLVFYLDLVLPARWWCNGMNCHQPSRSFVSQKFFYCLANRSSPFISGRKNAAMSNRPWRFLFHRNDCEKKVYLNFKKLHFSRDLELAQFQICSNVWFLLQICYEIKNLATVSLLWNFAVK